MLLCLAVAWWTMTLPGDGAMMRDFDYRIARDGGGCFVIMAGNVNVNFLGDNEDGV